ncbi:hypothetical protein BpHYR1_026018 [Brachionus plicatilis]|uniref:Uncharacterized protein n=1 Tax=Brachionus plicatilis TaxID=10195 RepID=A0A3M7PPK7_BRAPC|nr:hypothetical protein BpHYR1_026018 [Brachionus plicatilis]
MVRVFQQKEKKIENYNLSIDFKKKFLQRDLSNKDVIKVTFDNVHSITELIYKNIFCFYSLDRNRRKRKKTQLIKLTIFLKYIFQLSQSFGKNNPQVMATIIYSTSFKVKLWVMALVQNIKKIQISQNDFLTRKYSTPFSFKNERYYKRVAQISFELKNFLIKNSFLNKNKAQVHNTKDFLAKKMSLSNFS